MACHKAEAKPVLFWTALFTGRVTLSCDILITIKDYLIALTPITYFTPNSDYASTRL